MDTHIYRLHLHTLYYYYLLLLTCSILDLSTSNSISAPKLQVTTLPNGFRVATQETYGPVATFAVFVDAGSMYEAPNEVCIDT